jgi:hypothetical protein
VVDKQGKYRMMNQEKNSQPQLEKRVQVPAAPNESGQLQVQDHVRIYDPNTKETLLEKRA